ncbi:MAG: 30S ribosomal protein S6 [Candidatus Saccharibacteria bacterium]|nr:30S ribosomal protein S6 [Candidatus Saccharibacteria bacterium]
MKNYELTIVFHPDLEMNLDPALEKVKKTLEANQAKIITEENDGKKRLTYPIGKQDFGIYYYMELELPAAAPAKISSTFNISDEILRYLLVRRDERKAKFAALREAAAKANPKDTTDNANAEKED